MSVQITHRRSKTSQKMLSVVPGYVREENRKKYERKSENK